MTTSEDKRDSKLVLIKSLPLKQKAWTKKFSIKPIPWLLKVKAYFRELGVLEIMKGCIKKKKETESDGKLSTEDEKFNEKIDMLEGYVYKFLIQSCKGILFNLIANYDTSVEMWAELNDHYEPKAQTSLLDLKDEFYKCFMMGDYKDPMVWITGFDQINQQIAQHPKKKNMMKRK
jgi:hypothetical protein